MNQEATTVLTSSLTEDFDMVDKWGGNPLQTLCPPVAEPGIKFSCSFQDLQSKAKTVKAVFTELGESSVEVALGEYGETFTLSQFTRLD